MSEPKPFASLSSGLLARKGNARPAMRPQSFGNMGSGIEDLGWNDMGYAAAEAEEEPRRAPSPITALTPMTSGMEEDDFEQQPSVVEQQRAAIAASFGAEPMNEAEFEEALLSGAVEEAGVLAVKAKKPAAAPELKPEAPAEPARVQVQVPERHVSRATSGKGKAAFTLRLDPDRHLKLRLACAVSGRSAQQLVTEALDRLLDAKPEISTLAGQLPGGRIPN